MQAPCTSDSTLWVYPQNWPTLTLFLALTTQWRVSESGATGLDYAAIPVAAKALRIKLTESRFHGLRTMEGEALRLMSKSRS